MTKKIAFRLSSDHVAGATHGILVGDFNNWNTAEGIYLEKYEDGSLGAELVLTEGKTYEYRYLLSDGRWVNDNNNKKFVEAFGQIVENCVIDVPVTTTAAAKKTTKTKTPAATVKKTTKTKTAMASEDNLTKIEGINKNFLQILNADGIYSFKDLGKCTMKRLLLIIDNAGMTEKATYHTTWAKQAKLAAAGKWEELDALKKEIVTKK